MPIEKDKEKSKEKKLPPTSGVIHEGKKLKKFTGKVGSHHCELGDGCPICAIKKALK